jgi:organic radical activating enzyme
MFKSWVLFYRRYFKQNAVNVVYGVHSQLKPSFNIYGNKVRKKLAVQYNILKELVNYYILHRISVPQIEFVLTTRCTLRCQNCSVFMPAFNKAGHLDCTLEQFKKDFDTFIGLVDRVQEILLLGGEPLIYKDLPAVVDYVSANPKVRCVKVISNGTIVPTQNLLDALARHTKKTVFYISNYSANAEIAPLLKIDIIIDALKKNGVEYLMVRDLKWLNWKEGHPHNRSPEELTTLFRSCSVNKCMALMDGKIYVCSPAASYYNLGMCSNAADVLDLRAILYPPPPSIRRNFVHFYKRSYFDVCDNCTMPTRHDLLPALQIKDHCCQFKNEM